MESKLAGLRELEPAELVELDGGVTIRYEVDPNTGEIIVRTCTDPFDSPF